MCGFFWDRSGSLARQVELEVRRADGTSTPVPAPTGTGTGGTGPVPVAPVVRYTAPGTRRHHQYCPNTAPRRVQRAPPKLPRVSVANTAHCHIGNVSKTKVNIAN